MRNANLLNEIFRFKHKRPSDGQSTGMCIMLARWFAVFIEKVAKSDIHCNRLEPLEATGAMSAAVFSAHEVQVLQQVAKRLTAPSGSHKRGDVWFDPWLPQYGCVVQRSQLNATTIQMEVVFADGWERTLHFLPSGECIHSAIPTRYHSIHCVDLDVAFEASFSSTFPLILNDAQSLKGSDRSAVNKEGGHQKTPQFIAAIVRKTVNSLMEKVAGYEPVSVAPGGGTTDVGLHTGGRARDTCWPVVQAAIAHHLYCEPDNLFGKIMVAMKLHALEVAISDVETEITRVSIKEGCGYVDDLFFMLEIIVQSLVELLEDGYDVSSLEQKCAACRSTIDGFVDRLNHQTATNYVMPDATKLDEMNKLKCDIYTTLPIKRKDCKTGESPEQRRRRAVQNVDGCSFIDAKSCSLTDLLEWNETNKTPASYKLILSLRTAEIDMFERALRLNDHNVELTHYEEEIQTLVTQYQQLLTAWRKLPQTTSILDVEQRSRAMLVLWIAFCLVHQTCVQEIPLCGQYNIALDWKDLQVAVLSDNVAISALQNVAQYIRTWNKSTQGSPLFHLTNQAPTFEFARRFGMENTEMISIYNRQEEKWEDYVGQKWRDIETKKQEAEELREKMALETQRLKEKKSLLTEEQKRLRSFKNRRSPLKTQLHADIRDLNSLIAHYQQVLHTTLTMPPYLVRPLPFSKSDALPILCLLMMPRKLEILGNLCLTAQRALAPASAIPEMEIVQPWNPTTWEQFYTQYAPNQAEKATSQVFSLIPAPFSLPPSYGPRTVDDLDSLAQYQCECVWNPELSGSVLTWKDFEGRELNPFHATQASILDSYIERLPPSFDALQWMNAWPGEGDTRGNLVYARLDQQPEEVEKMAFIALGSLRAFPNQQFRKLQCALLDDVLPWSNHCVETIVRQSLYQIGVLTDELKPQLLWKTDMFHHDKEGLKRFCEILWITANKLQQTPRNFKSIPLLSELAGFVSQYTDEARGIVKLFAMMARTWAENARLDYMDESSPRRIAEIRQKECVLYGFALLSYRLGPWDTEAMQDVCELIVLFRTCFVCASINVKATELMSHTESRITEMMTGRISELVSYVTSDDATDSVLSGLVHLVNSTSPEQLEWNQFEEFLPDTEEQFGSCFEAFDEATNVSYAINLFSGLVLTDGFAPGGLPLSIRKHKQFVSLFGDCNFEVFSTNGVLRTERKYGDRLYDFALEEDEEEDEELLIQELSTDSLGNITRTLQLCSSAWRESLSDKLPIQLLELYSHWYWVEQHCVLFRPQSATSRQVYFVVTFDSSTSSLECFRVPFNDPHRPYDDIMNSLHDYDRFVHKDQTLLTVFAVLQKFEPPQFLYPLKSPHGVLKIELPRFKLMFYLNQSMQFESEEHKGYVLASKQQFDDFLPRFSRYLVLLLRDKTDTKRSELRVLLPVGSVDEAVDGMIDIVVPCEASTVVDVACFELHRRLKTLETETISARLEFAAICARAGTNVPSKRLEMTGAEAALDILRACRSSRPYADSERELLVSICQSSYREPAVKILAVQLLTEADRLAFLFDQSQGIEMLAMACRDEKSDYKDMCGKRIERNPLRSQFRRHEEQNILGHVQHYSSAVSRFTTEIVLCDSRPVGDNYVQAIETQLCHLLQIDSNSTKDVAPFPLDSSTSNAMSKVILTELQTSWNKYHLHVEADLKTDPSLLLGFFLTLQQAVSLRRVIMEKYVHKSILKATKTSRDRLLRLVNYLPRLTVPDLVRCAFDDETLYILTPKLSESSRKLVKQAVIMYLELCVLEDKVERLIWMARRSRDVSKAQLIQELENVRQWNPKEYPYWVAFEVEGRLQIRQEQYVIARHLLNHPGTVCQLNMGRGKTRVILPMLFLHFTFSRCPRVIRAHFLSPLLSEAHQFMHRYLTASNARLGILEQPFDRQIELSVRRLELIRDRLEELKMFGGIQMVAPEHRMSLELKRLELGEEEGPIRQLLNEVLASDQFVDVLDECDALLDHKYHLIYAVGTPSPLENGTDRWLAAQALLRIVATKTSGSRVQNVLQARHVSCFSPDYATRLGAYQGIRLNAVNKSTEHLRKELKEALVLDLIDHASFEYMWLHTIGRGSARQALLQAITNATLSLQDALGSHLSKLAPYMTQLLSLRGFVAFGVLEHCLEKRHRVDFGLPDPGSRLKKLAIPFRAADVPSERSEFSHPDVCIVLTLLGYYHSGLTIDELKRTFEMLLRLDMSEQEHEYTRWYTSIKPRLTGPEQLALSNVRHLSLADTRQFQLLCQSYRFCMETINFYLNTLVFPKDTQQYPQRFSRTAWNLAAGNHMIGFSGTNENHRLLPLTIAQQEPEEASLQGTNGKMLDKILQVTHSYEIIRPSLQNSSIPWQSVLLFAIAKRAQALIDTGALLAGVRNRQAAEFLLEQPDFPFAGVTYYESRKDWNCWMLRDKTRQMIMPLKKASMLENETFVLFDEARSRGSDMKLLSEASAVLTLGPRLTKDKLMQGAGRMRQLGGNQTLWLASFDEVAQSIGQLSGGNNNMNQRLSVRDVLHWVVDNTKAEAVRGLLEWAGNGIHFRKTQVNPANELVDENWSLETLYQEKLRADKIANVIQAKAFIEFQDVADTLVDRICGLGSRYGLDDEACVTSHTEECERELQVEEEEQREEENQVVQSVPANEKPWEYSAIFAAKSVQDIAGIVKVYDMKKFLHHLVSPQEVATLAWPQARVFGTENFFTTVKTLPHGTRLTTFLRVIDVALLFENGQVLLVSECEADHILELLWSSSSSSSTSSPRFRFLNLAFAWESAGSGGVHTKLHDNISLALGSQRQRTLPLLSLIACKVYNGEPALTKTQNTKMQSAYLELLRPLAQRETTLSNFVQSRGNSHKWTRSFLHELCRGMDIEDCALNE